MKRFLLLAVLTIASPMAFSGTPIALNGKPIATIVTQVGATAAEIHAAQDLQGILGKITGATIPLQLGATTAPRNALVVGQGPIAIAMLPNVDWRNLKEEQTVLGTHGSSLVIAGGRPRGTLYAVNRLLYSLGVRFWTPWASSIPNTRNLVIPNMFASEAPAYEYRDAYWFHAFDADWATHNYDNGFNTRIDEAHGGRIEYQGFVHTYYVLVPPDKLFATHPEWFSLINGKRVNTNAQLCTTNPELRDYVVEQVRQQLKANPRARIISVSQNDCFQPCQCPVCRALSAKEGSDSALVLDLVNYVAGKLASEFPNVAFDTLAYQWSRHPPRKMKPLPNVIVRLCSIECNFSYPLDATANAAFAQDIDGWSKLTNRLYIWDYCTDFANYVEPQPDYFTFGETFKFLYDHGSRGIFEEGDYSSNDGDMAEMKAWVMAQLFWNPNQNDQELIGEFLKGYYGVAAPTIYSYLKLTEDAAQQGPLSFAAPVSAKFLGYDTMRKAEMLWESAEAQAANNRTILWRIQQSHLSVQYVWLCRWAEFQKAAASEGDRWLLNPSRKAFAEQWLKTATSTGPPGWTPMKAVDEGGQTPQQFVSQFATDPP